MWRQELNRPTSHVSNHKGWETKISQSFLVFLLLLNTLLPWLKLNLIEDLILFFQFVFWWWKLFQVYFCVTYQFIVRVEYSWVELLQKTVAFPQVYVFAMLHLPPLPFCLSHPHSPPPPDHSLFWLNMFTSSLSDLPWLIHCKYANKCWCCMISSTACYRLNNKRHPFRNHCRSTYIN